MDGKETYSGSGSSSEDQSTEIGSTLVAQSSSRVNQSTDTVALKGRADKRGTPGSGSGAGLPGSSELLLGVGRLGALVSLAEERAHDSNLNSMVEDKTDSES